MRRKRDYLYPDTTYETMDDAGSGVVRRSGGAATDPIQSIDYSHREIPVLPFPDPLYREQWYFVSFFKF